MSHPVKLLLASVLTALAMWGLYHLAVWGYERIGLWILAVAFAVFVPLGFWFDRRDRRRLQRP
jgi:hypothetical protein